ncbi:MAG: hypothetical protein Q8K65_03535 [Alphaproteobacteria bacterium]|nr:hypothetical protein [Alphaproteobacteria bacterium]
MPRIQPAAVFSVSCRRTLLLLAIVLFSAAMPVRAEACKFQERPLADKISAAPVIAVGFLETIENGLVTLRVQQAIKGIAPEQQTIEFEMGQTSCHHRFVAGQRWLYMGTGYPSGSMLLEDEYARRIDENIAFVEAEFSAPAARQSLAASGTLSNSCAPWDGAALSLKLADGTGAHIYSGFGEIGETPRSFTLDHKMQRGSGQIIFCLEEGKPCTSAQGMIYLHRAANGEIEGRLEIEEGEHTRLKLFRVREEHNQQFCG